ncbi:hypothetical protein [Halomonas caseinilytica]|uniref:Uncharacterized protein n=1 Tax=Halomonas caseinilytica TaxID=438744 RepID=A0A1M6YBW3_9GAMM|nr:hypothetical protein [Halomonas caseinilytica]SHL15485.1 hypothetical protein SAMN05192556_108120 [Halomonas caseinilytica]
MAKFDRKFRAPVVSLSKADVERLVGLIFEGSDCPDEFVVSLKSGEATYEVGDVDSLFGLEVPGRVESLIFYARWDSGGSHSQRRVIINLGMDLGFCSVSSDGDEVWFRGKCDQVDRYLKDKAPWYASISDAFPRLSGGIVALLVLSGVYFVYHGAYYLVSICLMAIFFVEYLFKLYRDGRVFPRVKVVFDSGDREAWKAKAILVLTAMSVLGTYLGVGVNVYFALSTGG